MSGTGHAWRLWALLPPGIRIDQRETMQPNPHTKAILGEKGIGAALPVEGNRGAMATPGEAVGKSHFLAKGGAPPPQAGDKEGSGSLTFQERKSEKSGPEACGRGEGE